jgi:thiamine-phosphate pyrophosphorylase
MSKEKLRGAYVITDDKLTPMSTIYRNVEQALQGGATIVQLRDKSCDRIRIKAIAMSLQELCRDYGALFVLNDEIDLAIELECDGLHIGKSDYDSFESIRKDFKGVIGVSCYGDVEVAKKFERLGADYVAFGSFFRSPTKPNSKVVPFETIKEAKENLNIPVCVIGGIDTSNVESLLEYYPDMVSVISDIWRSEDITKTTNFYANLF